MTAQATAKPRAAGPRLSIVPPAIAFDARLEAIDVRVLLVFGAHIDQGGWCKRSQVRMARQLRVGRATVQRAIARLIEAGYLESRPTTQKSGGDGAHEYRVHFEPPQSCCDDFDEGEPTGPDGEGGDADPCPPAGTPLPASGHPLPVHGAGTPVNDPSLTVSRERRAREGGEIPDPEGLARFRREWPATVVDKPAEVASAWAALTDAERAEALGGIGPTLAARKAAGRKHLLGGASYLSERRWLPVLAATAAGASTAAPSKRFAEPWSKPFWALVLKGALGGADRAALRHRRQMADSRVGWPLDGVDLVDLEGFVATLRAVETTTPHAKAWGRWLTARGFDVDDRFSGKPFWVFLPEKPPPDEGESVEAMADEMARG